MTDKYWCNDGCGFVDKDHRCEQWSSTIRIPREAIERIRREYERMNRNLVSAIKEAIEKIRIGDEKTVDWSCARDAATRLKTALKWNDSDLAAIMGGVEHE